MKNPEFSFFKQKFFFSISGIFLPAFTAIPIIGIVLSLSKFGIPCTSAWKIVMTFSLIGGISLLVYFINFIKKENINADFGKKLLAFNLIEFMFLQAILTYSILDIKTLCYETDGQNGIQLLLSGWLGLPILVLISYFFDWKNRNAE